MSATLRAAVKAYLETQGLGVPVLSGRIDPSQSLPYIHVKDGITIVPSRKGNGRTRSVVEQVQVDVWQQLVDEVTNTVEEIPALANDSIRALDGCRLTTAPDHVYRVELFGAPRIPDEPNNLVRNSITVNITRVI